MAQKTIEYKILIDDAKSAQSLADLEQSAEKLNAELKELDPRSDDFKQLAKSAQEVDRQVEKISNSIEGIKFEDKIMAWDGATKILGGSVASVVGGFGLLGVESEKLEFLEKQATNAIAFAIGLKDLSEGAGQVATAFKKAGIASELFGKVTKRALIATGIGALIVALGTVIAYWEEITEFIKGSTSELEKQQGIYDEINTASQTAVDLLQMEYDNAVLRGESAVQLTLEIQKQLLLQQEQNNLLLEALELEIARVKAENEEVTTWEQIKIAASGFLGVQYQAQVIGEAINSESEETEGLQDKITDAKKRSLELEKQLLLIGQKINEEKKFEAFQSREPEQKLEIETVGLSEGDKAKIQSDADFNDLILYQQQKADDEYTQAVLENKMKLDEARLNSLDNLIYIAGAESNVGRALLIAKQIMLAKELFLEAKKTITFSAQAAARSTVAVAEGTAQTAKVGFPQNIPLLIGYAAQAAGIISAIVSATSKAKGVGGGGGNISVPKIPRRGGVPSTASVQNARVPQTLETTPMVQAYVVSGDVRRAEEADAKIKNRRTVSVG